ncbi:MAG: hypothetical protein JO257_07575 [Deltaproteobacteria bacterium]|nr:hypothetical protein [Deltaproteobacteria bacterium]
MKLVALCVLAACGTSSPGGADGSGLGTPENPVPQGADKGPYQVQTSVDLTVEAVLPPQAELVVQTLRDFSQNPAHTLIDLAGQEGVPAVATLYDALPSQLTDKLEGWINGEISKVKVNGVPLTTWAGDFAGVADTAFSQFTVDSTLAIDGSAATSTHTLTMLDFTPTGVLNVKIPITGLASDILTQHPTISVAEGGALGVGDQGFGLLFGEYAWNAVNAACTAQFGGDIRTTLGHAVNCAGIAHTIANKCVLGVCVGHEQLVDDMCEGGLDAIVNVMHDRFAQLNLEALHYNSGAARLVDDDGDGVADRIVDGTWDAQLNLGLGLRHTPATFAGTR